MNRINRFAGCLFAGVLSVFIYGCSTTGTPWNHLYEGPERPLDELAVIYADPVTGMYIKDGRRSNWTGARPDWIAVLPGALELTYGYATKTTSTTNTFTLNTTVKAGHKYQTLGSVHISPMFMARTAENIKRKTLSSIGTMSAKLIDITTQEGVWEYYEASADAEHKARAVRHMSDQDMLKKVAQTNTEPITRKHAVRRITDAAFLDTLLHGEKDPDARDYIQARIKRLRK